jgi:hypothetical protein
VGIREVDRIGLMFIEWGQFRRQRFGILGATVLVCGVAVVVSFDETQMDMRSATRLMGRPAVAACNGCRLHQQQTENERQVDDRTIHNAIIGRIPGSVYHLPGNFDQIFQKRLEIRANDYGCVSWQSSKLDAVK